MTPAAQEGPSLALPGTETAEVPHFKQLLQTPVGALPCLSLPGRHRQRTDTPYHARKQPPCQMAFGQPQPVAGVEPTGRNPRQRPQ